MFLYILIAVLFMGAGYITRMVHEIWIRTGSVSKDELSQAVKEEMMENYGHLHDIDKEWR